MMRVKLIPLGTNGFFPSLGRQTQSYLVLTDEAAIMLDAGTGVGRLLEPEIAELIRGYDRLNIFLSHYHLDHCGGLMSLSEVWPGSEVVIHGPAPPFAKASPSEALNTLLNAPFSPPIEAYPFKVSLVPVNTTSMTIEGIGFRFRGQRHWRGSMGIRIADDITYVTDTVADDDTIDLARDVKLLMHELWMTDEEFEADEIGAVNHSHVSGVARIAKEANVGRLMVTHHQPKRRMDEIQAMADEVRDLSGVEVLIPEETKHYEL